ncbi:hypothetical protein NHQ30_010301 [Ciborinia camelliae]|nr:hypothetical protein NHQ30_010301 [Ciborinia camelliae]
MEKIATNPSTQLESPFDDYEQDWSTTTPESQSWASRERRRSTPFGNLNNTPFMGSHHEGKHYRSGSSTHPRKGSILSVWSDPNGDDEHDNNLRRVSTGKSEEPQGREGGGTVLSLFRSRKDEQGRDIIHSEGA